MRTIRRLGALLGALALCLGATGVALAVPGPQASADAYTTDEDTALTVSAQDGLLANDNATVDTCAVVVDDAGLAGSVELAFDGSFTFTPTANFNGETTFEYGIMAVGDQTCGAPENPSATVKITVTPVNDAPTAGADSFGVVKNVTLNVFAPGLLANDHDVDNDSLTAVGFTNPSHGILIHGTDGSFSYTPNSGYVGPDAFSYKASDGTASSATRVVSLTVTAIPPIATPTPIPTPSPTLTPIATPEATVAEPSTSPEVTPSIEPSASPIETVAASVGPSPSPGASPAPEPVDTEGGGISLPVLLVIILFVLLVGFGAALYVPKWLAAQRGEPSDLD